MRKLDLSNPNQEAGKILLDGVMKNLKDKRIKRGLTQKQVADQAHISLSIVSKYERGLYPTRLVWFAAICDALDYEI